MRNGLLRRMRAATIALSLTVALAALIAGLAPGGASASAPAAGSTGLPAALAGEAATAQACSRPSEADDRLLDGTCEWAARQVGTEAYRYGIPLMEFEHEAQLQTSVDYPNALADAPVNELGSDAELNTPAPGHSVFVQPNVDTLYTMGHLDLSKGPFLLHIPAVSGGRYYVFQFLDPYTNTFAYVGTRTTGDGVQNDLITPPGWTGRLPKGTTRIAAPYDQTWICGRTLVNGPSDLAAVHRIQARYQLIPEAKYLRYGLKWKPHKPAHLITTATDPGIPSGLGFFSALDGYLAQNPPPAADAPILADLREVGIGPGLNPSAEGLSAPVLNGLREAADGGLATIADDRTGEAATSAVGNHGWFVPYGDTGNFGTDYAWRAVVTVYGLGANETNEAMYIVGVLDNLDTKLNAAQDYEIHFPADALPPARYFWSLTMYDANFSLVPNALGRYALANHIPGLKYNADGSLTIYLSHGQPPAADVSNWLPAPASGNFEVTLRLYGPGASALGGSYVYPQIQRVKGF